MNYADCHDQCRDDEMDELQPQKFGKWLLLVSEIKDWIQLQIFKLNFSKIRLVKNLKLWLKKTA